MRVETVVAGATGETPPFLCPWSPFFRFEREVNIRRVRSASRLYRVMFELDKEVVVSTGLGSINNNNVVVM